MKVYTSSKCLPCKILERELDKRGIEYEEISLDSEEGRKEAIKKGIEVVPTVEIGDHRFEGYNKETIRKIIELI